ncbi:hypothetical protein EHF33_00630 [Deinococcus psychrotolerans]|uniref:Uncharacterized protein n=1 Tax=Deinococcus psychrotolerans TaxID=2489213 RepID=A0A3G8YJ32_9DEIO|nr:hypothetical protein [Deinococcus psychrotolerans]AZI41441.1 hypothetical protein EHF33_00630 [Deinococcus psychrotolerans]
MKKFMVLPLMLVACGTIPTAPVLSGQSVAVQRCGTECSAVQTPSSTDTASRSYLVNFKEILYVRANAVRSTVQFGKDSANPACLLSVKAPSGVTSVNRGSGTVISVSNALLSQSIWNMACPEYNSGWNVF